MSNELDMKTLLTKIHNTTELFMKTYYTEELNSVKTSTARFNSELSDKLFQYYLRKVNGFCRHSSDKTTSFSFRFCKHLNEINNPNIEFYLHYCLEFFEESFSEFLFKTYNICSQANFALKNICKNYLRYCGKKDMEMLLEDTFRYIPNFNNEIPELTLLLNNIIELEKNHILECYELAKNGETFCKSCAPMCWIESKDMDSSAKKVYKRTTPFRH